MSNQATPFFATRSVILLIRDILTADWLTMAKQAGLTTIATHVKPGEVSRFMQTQEGIAFREQCIARQIHLEHELHAIGELLPRDLFEKNPSMFRMDENGERTPDANLCVHSKDALEIVVENALAYAEVLCPTTGRYFFWVDDAKPMCKCPQCRHLSDSDQALILENEIIKALRKREPAASLAHLAYQNTILPPAQIKPAAGIFLEFAPILRSYRVSISRDDARTEHPERPSHARLLEALDANLEAFAVETAQVLEYWLDVSMFAGWQRAKTAQLPWSLEVLKQDLRAYAKRGIRNISCFACWIDGDYIARFGLPPVREYGEALLNPDFAVLDFQPEA